MEYRTTDLLNELSKKGIENNFKDFMEEHKNIDSFDCLRDFFNDYFKSNPDINVADAIKKSNIDRGYAYQILSGRKPHPGKYKLVMLCICFEMNLKNIQRALTISGNAVLYPKYELDAALIVCINNGYSSMIQVTEFLCRNGLELPE